MAWKSREKEAMAKINDHQDVLTFAERRAFVMAINRLVFLREGMTGVQAIWITHLGFTKVTLWGPLHVLNNLRLDMVKESMGFGPAHYCIPSSN